jgi:hypothetical protein
MRASDCTDICGGYILAMLVHESYRTSKDRVSDQYIEQTRQDACVYP